MSTYNSKTVVPIAIFSLLLIGSLVLFYINTNLSSPFYVLTMGFVVFILFYILTITQMVRTGRMKAKGAKKRRRRILPLLYRKKASAARYDSLKKEQKKT